MALLYSFPSYGSGAQGYGDHYYDNSYTFPTPVTVTSVSYSANAYGSTDGYSSFYHIGAQVYVALYNGTSWIYVAQAYNAHSNSNPIYVNIGGTSTTVYPHIIQAAWHGWCREMSDHDQYGYINMNTFSISGNLGGNYGYFF